ncbi:hypothetical protein SAMN06265337_3550 [Hymenobacter gelipurpurascens]|uniref:MORN repeat variant n=1 Tax=Hymenobacter gelipurpurascens TaxID=89968 RepID=A0A212UF08_9BACT|nr:hypothetical protein [Hymenobacter gelipurpurascens]SNC76763.1 hypothetical protein SAMN06265337_3550 [Hymenobacter gelipurpurascens]
MYSIPGIKRRGSSILFLAGLLGLLMSSPAAAQQPDSAAQSLRAFYCVLGSDSVALYYTPDYELTLPGCATIRRHTRINSAGQFFGFVRDYWLSNNQPALKGAYNAQGRKEGPFEIYHPDGTVAASGTYHNGRQIGNWGYWYPSGAKRQVLSFGDGTLTLIQQFWSETGEQLVKDGTGTWYRTEEQVRLGGPVLNGRPDGRWQVKELTGKNALVAQENYRKGRFVSGFARSSGVYYTDEPTIYITDWDNYSEAEQFKTRPVCPPSAK